MCECECCWRLTTAGCGQDGIGHRGSTCDGGGVAEGRRGEHEERLGEHLVMRTLELMKTEAVDPR